MTKSFTHFSAEEVAEGMRFADENYGVLLDRQLFASLANRTGATWCLRGRPKNGALHRIKHEVLNKALELQSADVTRRNAYSSSISKMFGNRAAAVIAARKRREEEAALDMQAADALWSRARRPRAAQEARHMAAQRNDIAFPPN